jgi:hypothetical protein
MSIFVVVEFDQFKTKQKVNKLIRDGRCLADEFINEIRADKNLAPELSELFATIEDVANNKIVPPNRYKILHLRKNLNYTPYEAKSKHLRLYLFFDKEKGQIIIFGGKKGSQAKDLKNFEKRITEYSNYEQQKKKKRDAK